MTSQFFEPQQLPGYLPFLSGSPVDASPITPPAPLHWRTFKLPATDPDVLAYGQSGVLGWELKVDDLRGGYTQSGDFARGANPLDGDYRMTSNSTLDQRFRRHLMLPFLESKATLAGIAGGSVPPSFFANHRGLTSTTMYFARGGTASAQLWQEVEAGGVVSWTPVPSAAAVCQGLASVVIGGATNPERLVFFPVGAAPVVVVVGSPFHSNLNPCWGMLTSPINAASPGTGTILIYANSGIWSLPITAAIGAAPVQILSNVPNGGYAVGVEKLPKGPLGLRAFWGIPASNATSANAGFPVKPMTTNMEGSDPLPIPIPMSTVRWQLLWRRSWVGADTQRVFLFDGDESRDLHVLNNRQLTNGNYQIDGLAKNDNDLFVFLSRTSGGVTTQWAEQYLPDFDSWVPVTPFFTDMGHLTVSTGGIYGGFTMNLGPMAEYPVSQQSGYLHLPAVSPLTTVQSYFMSPSGQNPYYLYQELGSTPFSYTKPYAPSGTWTGPYWELPQLEGRWKRADEIVFLGSVDDANADCSVGVSINGDADIVFAPGTPHVAQLGETGTAGLWMQLQLAITVTRGSASNTKRTPNALPILVRGRAYLVDPEQNISGVPPGP